jgi:hypothetical protein
MKHRTVPAGSADSGGQWWLRREAVGAAVVGAKLGWAAGTLERYQRGELISEEHGEQLRALVATRRM